MGIFRWIAGNRAWLTVALAAVAIVAGLVAILLCLKTISGYFGLPDANRLDIVRTYLVVGGGLLIWQLYIANRRAASAERTAELAALGNITGRLDSAIEHLESNASIVRIGGLYQLHHIARDAPGYRGTVSRLVRSHIDYLNTRQHTDLISAELAIAIRMLSQKITDGGVYYEEASEDFQ